MNIKGLFGSMIPSPIRGKERVEKGIKTDSTTDRDANGQMAQDQGQKKRPPMNEEQKKKALEHLRGLAVVRDNNLIVEWHVSPNNKTSVIIKELSGKIVRRISEEELWTLQAVKDNEKGQLLSKSA